MVISALLLAAAVAAGDLHNAAQTSLGATATFAGAPNNRDWPAKNAIPEEVKRGRGGPRGGCMFGAPMEGGTISIRLLVPCTIERVDLMQLDYRGTMNVKKAEIAVDGKVMKTVELPEKPGTYQEIPLRAKGQVVSVKCLSTHPRHTDAKTGKPGPNWGGWARIRVMVNEDLGPMLSAPDGYSVEANPEALTPTGTGAHGAVEVEGRPRIAKGHPCTTWDKEDVQHYRGLLKTSPEFAALAKALRSAMDRRMEKPIGVPQPQKDAEGKWKHLSDGGGYGKIHNQLSLDIANLGTCYQLFGEAKYAAFCKKMLLAYADAWPNYGVGARGGFSHDPSKVFDQRLGDATWLIQVAIGYDFIHDWDGITAAERAHIEKDLVAGSGYFIFQNRSHLRGATNWSAIGTAAVLAAGYACDDEGLVKTALFGVNWCDRNSKRRGRGKAAPSEPSKWWEGTPNATPSGVELHFSEKCIDVDGMWCEGAMGYQFMALQALVLDAEILWRHGIDLYRYRNGALKCIFDSPILFAYPTLVTPAIHDSGNANIVGREAYLYEFGYRRYRDPAYLRLLRQTGRRLGASFQQFTVSCLYDIDFAQAAKAAVPESVNLNGVGYGVLRVTDGEGTRNLLLDYGPNRSHGHPDKLNIDLWAFGALQVPDPGSAWYETPIYRNWYRTTFAHNTLSVDMQEQEACGADLLAFAPGESFGMMRGRTSEAYPGVTMDRTVFLTRDYVADLFGAFSRMKRTYDLAWHPRGDCAGVSGFDAAKAFRLPSQPNPGYSMLRDVKSVTDSLSHRVDYVNKGRKTALVSAAAEPTEFVVGKVTTNKGDETAVFERRVTNSTVFGNVFDLGGKVKRVTQTPWSRDSDSVVLEIALSDGGKDRCAASYKTGEIAFASIEADGTVTTIAASGTGIFSCDGATLKLNPAKGGAVVERTETGSYLVRNCSSVPGEIAVTLPKLGSKTFKLKAGETAEWLVKGAKPIAAHKAEMMKKLAAAEAAAAAKAKAARETRIAARQKAAKAQPGAKGTSVLVEAESFSAQGGGEVKLNDRKTAVRGSCFSHWDAEGQWVEWKARVPSEGYYNLSLCYCTDAPRQRALLVNGEAVADADEAVIPATGGFSNGSDDWRMFTFPEPEGGKLLPVRFKAGENVIRMVNVGGGGINMDYILVTSPDTKIERMK